MFLRPIYWQIRNTILNNYISRKIIINQKNIKVLNEECPICKSCTIKLLRFKAKDDMITKKYCPNCAHIFTSNLKANPETAKLSFDYEKENKFINDQIILLKKLMQTGENKKLLDFGIGGNYSHLNHLNHHYKNKYYIMGCDIYNRNADYYFTTYNGSQHIGTFDGISSHAVVEHLDNTIEAWVYLNKLLKPIEKGGGIMIHSFPSQIIEDLFSWQINVATHECLFSRQSLDLTLEKTGFELTGIKLYHNIHHPVFYFKKIKNLCAE